MEAFAQILQGLVDHPTACLLALALIALGWLYKARAQDQKDFIEIILKREDGHRETLLKVIPAAEKLTDSVVILERIIAHKD